MSMKPAETEVYLDEEAQKRLAAEVDEFCTLAAERRRPKDIAWAIARRMVAGDQWIRPTQTPAPNGGPLVETVNLPGRMEKWKIVANRLLPGMDTRLAHVLKNKPIGVVVPETQDEEDRNASRIADEVVEYDFRTLNYQQKMAERGGPMTFTDGTGFWHWYWDPLAGPEVEIPRYLQTQSGEIVTEPTHIEVPNPITGAPEMQPNPSPNAGQPIPIEPLRVPRGEPALEFVPADEVFLDPAAKEFDDGQMLVRQTLRPIDEVRNMLEMAGVDKEKLDKIDKVNVNDRAGASTVASARLQGVSVGELASRCEVRVVWAKPNKFKGWPQGLRSVFVNRELYIAEPTPPGSDAIPFAQQIERPVPNDIYGTSSVIQAIPLQKALNIVVSRDEYRRTVQRPKLVTDFEAGVDEDSITNEDSDIVQKNHGYTVEWLQAPTYESDPRAIDRYLALIDDIFGNVAILMGESDGEVRSGRQAFIQGEYAGTALSGPARSIERVCQKVGAGLLKLRKANTSEARDVQIVGKNRGIEILQFRGSDLAGAGDYFVEPGSALPMSLAQKKQMIFEMVDRKMLSPDRALRLLPVPSDLDAEMDDQRLDRDRATEENLMFSGLDEAAVAQAVEAAQPPPPMADPMTGTPLPGPDPLDGMKKALEQFGLEARPEFEDNLVHLETHNKFRKTAQYRRMPKVSRSLLDFHCAMHLPDMPVGPPDGGPGGGGAGKGGDQGDALPQGLMPGMPSRLGGSAGAGAAADQNGDIAGGLPPMPPTPSGGIQA